MKQFAIFVALVATAVSSSATTIKGKITSAAPASGKQVVVWIDEPATAKPSSPAVISQKGMKYTPETSAVVVGQTVDFPNDDDSAHQVYSVSPTKKFNLGFYGSGEKRSVVMDKPGVVEVRCYIHQQMKATLVVVPGTRHSMTTVGGTYRIDDVAPGKRVLKLWTPSGEQRKEVVVPASGEITVDFIAP